MGFFATRENISSPDCFPIKYDVIASYYVCYDDMRLWYSDILSLLIMKFNVIKYN